MLKTKCALVKITSSRELGTIAMTLSYIDDKREIKIINMTAPVTQTVEIASITTATITFTSQIDSDTQDSVEVEILSYNT